jgi:hypothetical protein
VWSAVLAASLAGGTPLAAQTQVRVVTDAGGSRLQVDGRDLMVLGMNWDYFPIGENYAYNFWGQSDAFIRTALDREMGLLKSMGVNAIRQYVGVPPRWVRYIYEQYGIYTVLNHAVGRYGVTVNGRYLPNTDYSDPRVRAQLTQEVAAMVEEFRGTPGLLMYLLGNENNYGLEWKSAETENLPVGERNAAKARYLYSLMGEIARDVKTRDPSRPVAMANGDLQYIDIIATETKGLDVFGTNVYRGISFGTLFQEVKDKLGIPVMFTEFGADAFNARERREDQLTQARYLLGQWQEIYQQSAGKGGVGNSIGGMTFQWSDGWWKVGQESNLDVQDIDAGWANAAYPEDYVPGQNNMNEEWWGIMAKGPTDASGHFELFPRAAFYALQRAYTLDPYAPGTDRARIDAHFAQISPDAMVLLARGNSAALQSNLTEKVRVAGMRLGLATFSTGGNLVSTPDAVGTAATGSNIRPTFRGFDHLETYYVDLEARPASNVTARLSLNAVGNVPDNPINELFWEAGARTRGVQTEGQTVNTNGLERLRIYGASLRWDEQDFQLDGFYRTGHYHWQYEGDFFGLYREANYGPNMDIYGGLAPLGVELTGRRSLEGFKFAIGPELWWGANPAMLAKYRRQVGRFTVTGVHQEDFVRRSATASSFAVPQPQVSVTTMHLATTVGPAGVELGGIWGGRTRVGRTFQIADGEPGNYRVLQDRIKDSDALGAKAKVTLSSGAWNWYAQGAAMGLVADGGQNSTMTFTGWQLKESGMGNNWNALTGFTWQRGNLQVAPNFLWQKPIVGPVPSDVPAPGRPRNILDDPFSVRWNRETVAGELLLTWDPTPSTYMYAWDSDQREDARLAGNLGIVYRHLPTTQDAAIGILADGRTLFAFPGAAPAQDLWEVRSRIVARPTTNLRLIANVFGGTGQANGDSDRLIRRYGGDLRVARGPLMLTSSASFNNWGPFDYHRDFNLTFPAQYMTDLSYRLGRQRWMDAPASRFGVVGMWRSLDRFSPRYCPAQTSDAFGSLTCDPTAPGGRGSEWEIRTYVMVGW